VIDPAKRLEELVLAIHRRNGGDLQTLDFSLPLLHPSLRLDSLDLAEIMAAIEQEFGGSPFDAAVPPRTWQQVCHFFELDASA
jgi:acyl carrier protein